MTSEGRRKDHRDERGHVGDDRGDLCSVSSIDRLNQDTHEDRSAHKGGAHHEGRAGVKVDDLLLHLGTRIVHKDRDGNAEHERNVAREDVLDEERDDGDGEDQVEPEELRPCELVLGSVFSRSIDDNLTLFLRKLAGEACTAGLLLEAGENRMSEAENDAEDLNRDKSAPQRTGFNAEDGCGTHGRAGPRHQVQDAHREDRDAEQGRRAHVHSLVDRKHGRNHDTECGSAAAVQVADQSDDSGHQGDADDVVADELHQLADDDVEHARVSHDAEVQDREDEQRRGRTRAAETGFDQGCDVVPCVIAADDEDDAKDSRDSDECDTRQGAALEEQHDDRDDRQKA